MRHNPVYAVVLTLLFVPMAHSSPLRFPAAAPQENGWDAVARLPQDASLEVERRTGAPITGPFRSANDDELIVISDGQPMSLPRPAIRRIRLISGNKAGLGALIGLGIGAATELAVNSGSSDAEYPLHVALIGGGLGARIGALVGLAWRNRTVIYDEAVPARVQVVPIVTRERRGIRLSFRFD